MWLQILTWAIIARALLSWFPIDQGSQSPFCSGMRRISTDEPKARASRAQVVMCVS